MRCESGVERNLTQALDDAEGDNGGNGRAGSFGAESIPAGALDGLSQIGLLNAFEHGSFGGGRPFTPRDLMALRLTNRLFSRLSEDKRFWRAWGYVDGHQLTKTAGAICTMDRHESGAAGKHKPLLRWALDGRIDKKRFERILASRELEHFLDVAQKETLSEEETWRVVELEAAEDKTFWHNVNGTGALPCDLEDVKLIRLLLIPYAKGQITVPQIKRVITRGAGDPQGVAQALFEGGALYGGWERYLDRCNSFRVLIAAILDLIEPGLFESVSRPPEGFSYEWGKRGLRAYYNVQDLSTVHITEEDSARCPAGFGARTDIPDTVMRRMYRCYQLDDHILFTQVYRRRFREKRAEMLERERAVPNRIPVRLRAQAQAAGPSGPSAPAPSRRPQRLTPIKAKALRTSCTLS